MGPSARSLTHIFGNFLFERTRIPKSTPSIDKSGSLGAYHMSVFLFYFYEKTKTVSCVARLRMSSPIWYISGGFEAVRLIIKMQKVRITDREKLCSTSSRARWSWSNRLRQSNHFKRESELKNSWKGRAQNIGGQSTLVWKVGKSMVRNFSGLPKWSNCIPLLNSSCSTMKTTSEVKIFSNRLTCHVTL